MLNIWIPKIMTVIVLNYAVMCLKDADGMVNSVGPDLDLHCLLKPVSLLNFFLW